MIRGILDNFKAMDRCVSSGTNKGGDEAHERQVGEIIGDFTSTKNNMTYVKHPNGAFNSPDFRVITDCGKMFNIECKSSIGTSGMPPKLGDGRVESEYIFVFTNKIGTTFILGHDTISAKMSMRIKQQEQRRKADYEYDKKIFGHRIVNSRLSILTPFNWMLSDRREKHEARVYDYVKTYKLPRRLSFKSGVYRNKKPQFTKRKRE